LLYWRFFATLDRKEVGMEQQREIFLLGLGAVSIVAAVLVMAVANFVWIVFRRSTAPSRRTSIILSRHQQPSWDALRLAGLQRPAGWQYRSSRI
jgi:hypothetical protein